MLDIVQTIKRNANTLTKLLPLLSFIIPFLALYSLYPDSFEMTWKGRTYHLFFLWLFALETILIWKEFQTEKRKLKSIRTIAFIMALLLPTIYVIDANYFGLNMMIADLAGQHNVPLANWMPLSIEYLVFAVLFALIILLEYGIDGLVDFSISVFFLGIIGVIYIIDNVYPEGRFTPFQIFVPTTATLAADILNCIGYQTRFLAPIKGMPRLEAWKTWPNSVTFDIAWPCSGVESLLLYTVTILLFLKKTIIPWRQRIVYFVIGAIVTYFINVLRIVTIFAIAINGGDWWNFHNYYGQLYSITWIISYPLIIIGSRTLWEKIRSWKTSTKDASDHLR
jgi:thaumarchaeosortase